MRSIHALPRPARRVVALATVLAALAGCDPDAFGGDGAAPSLDRGSVAASPGDAGDDGIGACGDDATPVSAVQGPGDASPLVGREVVIEGIVVGDFLARDDDPLAGDLDGFHLEEEAADRDDDPATSEGVFVYAPGGADVEPGRVVRVRGRVTEFEGLTELVDVDGIVACGREALPLTDVTLPLAAPGELERYEGMRVRLPQELVIAEYFDFDRYGEIVLARPAEGRDRPYVPTAFVAPDAARDVHEAQELRRVPLDDGRASENPYPARHPDGGRFTAGHGFRGGDVIADVIGIVDGSFDRHRIQPTTGARHETRNPRPAAPDVGGELRVASFNVLNYFTTLGSRGADTPEALERQRAKIVAAARGLDADVLALVEIENDPAALVDVVDALNETAGAGTYAPIRTGPIGGDEIRVAIAYRPGAVTPVGEPAVLDAATFLDPAGTGVARNRPALAQTFRSVAGGGEVTVVVNHLKSRGSSCGPGDDDPVQGACNLTRTRAADALLSWLRTDPTGAGDPDLLLLGDYNAYDEEAPIARLLAGFDGERGGGDDLVDLLERHGGEFVYTYVFDGRFGHLDHALASPSLAGQVTGAAPWHVNADEPDLLDYDTTFDDPRHAELYAPTPFRSSDHDPILVGLDLERDGDR